MRSDKAGGSRHAAGIGVNVMHLRSLYRHILCGSAFALLCSLATAQQHGLDSSRAWDHLKRLVELGPRPSGSTALENARRYIETELHAIGLVAERQTFEATTPIGSVLMANIIARVPGELSTRIVLGGHYDTKLYRDFVFVGANDGGSSAAFLIELARVLKVKASRFTYELVWFDGEEAVGEWREGDHTYGSRHYVGSQKRRKQLDSIGAVIVFDMIAGRNLEIKRERHSSMWLTEEIWAASQRLQRGHTFVDASAPIEDDHVPFLREGVPGVVVIGYAHFLPHWHKPSDNLSNVDAQSLQVVGDVILEALPRIEERILKINR